MNEERAVDSHRDTIREHIEKYKRYEGSEKNTALSTIENAQQQISDIRRRKSSIPSSWEDDWRP
ncbi:MAG: hypothetical protein PHO20_04845 [Candidatus Peribacteraceae bacterium]|nr:hypothetical protein [Candidatus Peribacteraceae bacterium]MDD5740063.1 hypothetical protein [Candidatus Peribacteraceae bacterium]